MAGFARRRRRPPDATPAAAIAPPAGPETLHYFSLRLEVGVPTSSRREAIGLVFGILQAQGFSVEEES
jgi:hypothetical protein